VAEGLIYALVDPRTPGEIRYVGQTRMDARKRWHAHVCQAGKGKTRSAKWISSLTFAGVRPLMVPICRVAVESLGDVERAWISHYRGTGQRLTNITEGGEGHPGPKTPEHQEKISAWHRGRIRSAETRRRISEALRGRRLSDAQRAQRSSTATTPGTLARSRDAALKRWADPSYRERNMAGLSKRPKHPKKLNWDAVRDIRRQHGEGVATRELARRHGVTPPAIRAILRQEVWREEKVS
jgi:hypothetical protein